MRYGSGMRKEGLNPDLAKRLQAIPIRARPILETVVTAASDIKDTRDDFNGADSTAGFLLYAAGGVRLSGSSSTAAENTTRLAGKDITALVPPISDTIDCGLVVWGGGDASRIEIHKGTAFLDPNTGGGLEVTHWVAQIFRLMSGTLDRTNQIWTFAPISQPIRVTEVSSTNGVAGDVTFVFAAGQGAPLVGPRPDVNLEARDAGIPVRATTAMFVWAIKGGGEVASNVAWECDSGNASKTSGSHTVSRRQFSAVDTDVRRDEGTRYVNNGASAGVPAFSLRTNSYTASTIAFTATGNRIKLSSSAATATTTLEVVAHHAEPVGTIVTVQLRRATGTATDYTTVLDGDAVGVNKSGDGGTDLSGLARGTKFDMRATLTPSTADITPRLFRIGMREVTSEQVDGLADFGNAAWAVDPISCQSEVPSVGVSFHRDGVKDFRSFGEELLADNHLNDILFRVWIGHPSLNRKHWLHIDDFLVEDYDPGDDTIDVAAISPLKFLLDTLPPKVTGARSPISYEAQTLKAVRDDLLTGQLGVQSRYIGPGVTDTSTTVTKEVRDKQAGIDTLREIDFLSGGATISSQGRFKFVRLFDDTPPFVFFEQSAIEILAIDAGYDRRITSYDVPYGWTEDDGTGQSTFTAEREHAAATGAIANLGPASSGQDKVLDESTAKWIIGTTLADTIGTRMVQYFGTGLSQIRFRTDVPYPQLEPGDPVAIEQDRYVGRDPNENKGIRGKSWVSARITQCHNLMGTEFTAWVQSWVNFLPGTTAITQTGFAKPVIVETTAAFTASGGLLVRLRSNKDTGSIRIVANVATATAFPLATTVAAQSPRIPDAEKWVEIATTGVVYAYGDNALVSAKAYETPTGGGAAGTLAQIKIKREGSPDAANDRFLSGAMTVAVTSTGGGTDVVYSFTWTVSTGVSNPNHDVVCRGAFATTGGWDITTTVLNAVAGTKVLTDTSAGLAGGRDYDGEISLVGATGATLQTLQFSDHTGGPL